ncbi:hypothetical protein BDU57DRAFT_320822 [Ampelomyces quisqualis]|uniref:Uncharacterized protein n=1 Tax=Ampelomyces quisqualis TaxID=50730 RepID=A0A6A5QDP9_AMPQU|nr:hypothetical protein BDU57DRAFT_320822 [Ampelomyces quisqualis]
MASPDLAVPATEGSTSQVTSHRLDTQQPGGPIHLHGAGEVTTALHNWSGQQPESPTRTANIRIRRSRYGSALLQSPARAGHTACMQQIFEAVGHSQHELHSTPTALYPQLPNISRKALPTLDRSPDASVALQPKATCPSKKYYPKSLCLSTNLSRVVASASEAHASLTHTSNRSSGSWSDDSGYIATNLRARGHSFNMDERIHDWLRALSGPESQDSKGLNEQCPSTPDEHHVLVHIGRTGRSQAGSSQSRHVHQEKGLVMAELSDPFVCDIDGRHLTTASSSDVQGHGTMAIGHANVTKKPMSHVSNRQSAIPLHGSCIRMSRSVLKHSPPRSFFVGKTDTSPLGHEVLDEGGVQLSPLTPDVCTERGPSRYHNRNLKKTCNTKTPSRARPTMTFQAPLLKENDFLKELGSYKSDDLFTPSGSRTGTRFRRGQ